MRYVPIEEARKRLGRLIRDASGGEPVVIGQRGANRVVLMSEAEYERLRRLEEDAARALFERALGAVGAATRRQKTGRRVVDEAIRVARRR